MSTINLAAGRHFKNASTENLEASDVSGPIPAVAHTDVMRTGFMMAPKYPSFRTIHQQPQEDNDQYRSVAKRASAGTLHTVSSLRTQSCIAYSTIE